jgi:LPPG:FO 2-phospho-L-lactate transferase
MMDLVMKKKVVAVSPIIGGKALKGPAAKMFNEMGIEASSLAVARHYQDFLSGFVLDDIDVQYAEEIQRSGIISLTTNTIMQSIEDRKRLAAEVLSFCEDIFFK